MSRLRELFDRHLAGEDLEGDELEAVIAEYDRVLEAQDLKARNFAIGRKTAAKIAKVWGEDRKAVWFSEAVEVLQERPGLLQSLKALAYEVRERCERKGVTKRDGSSYDQATIRNYLTGEAERLSAALESFTRQASAVE